MQWCKNLLSEEEMNSNYYIVSSTANSITISWNSQHVQENIVSEEITQYETKYRQPGEKFKNADTHESNEEGESEITGLFSDTLYDINVYWFNGNGDSHLLFTVCFRTKEFKETFLMENARADKSKKPFVYHLNPVHTAEYKIKVKTENNLDYLRNKDGTCVVDRFRVCDMISNYKPGLKTSEEKTLLLLGATGTGKSTFVEALINYIANVSFDDDHRFSLINKTDEEKEKVDKQFQSQTTSVTVYRIPKVDGFQVNYQINIIDTPGFNDTEGKFDKRIIEQIKELFERRINHLDAILVVIPLSTTRLTEAQEEVFSNITRMFGEDIAENILIAITWDDGGKETCLTVLRAAKVPINETFRFSNAFVLEKYPPKDEEKNGQTSNEKVKKNQGTLDEKVGEPQETSNVKVEESPQEIPEYIQHSMYKSLWDKRKQSFSNLFKKLEKMQRTTVKSSLEVMRARINLEIRLASLKEEITEQAQLVANYVQDKDILFRIEHETPENKKKASYSEIEIEMQLQFYGKSSLNCRKCRKTCHKNCWVPINPLNRTCEAMENKNCTVCEGRCGLNDHSLEKYIYEPKYVTKLYSGEDVVNRQKEREIAFSRFKQILGDTGDLIDILNGKALEKNVLTLPIFIRDLISKENEDHNPGFQLRIHLLQKICDYLKQNDSLWKISLECLS